MICSLQWLRGTGIETIFWYLASFSTPFFPASCIIRTRKREKPHVLTLLQLGFWTRLSFCLSNALRQGLEAERKQKENAIWSLELHRLKSKKYACLQTRSWQTDMTHTLPCHLRGSTALRTPWPRVPSLQDWETIHLCCLLPLNLWDFVPAPLGN